MIDMIFVLPKTLIFTSMDKNVYTNTQFVSPIISNYGMDLCFVYLAIQTEGVNFYIGWEAF